jgi:hypothetical protein
MKAAIVGHFGYDDDDTDDTDDEWE